MDLAARRPIVSSSASRAKRSSPTRARSSPPAGVQPSLFALESQDDEGPSLRQRLVARQARFRSTRFGQWSAKLVQLAVLVGLILGVQYLTRPLRGVDQAEVDYLIEQALQTKPIPAFSTAAYAAIRPSVVRVVGGDGKLDEDDPPTSVGSGVVIVDSGLILTNLHVISGAKKIGVVFSDGTESEARVVSTQPENDLAVIQATTLPDDLVAAKLGSTRELQVGDHVLAVGFPFGIGPSASAGIVSGLKRAHETQDGTRPLSNLIQFDAAANPGNSGGPLVSAQGEVLGIVTGILNPTQQRVFIGIGFAVPIESAASAVGMPPF